MSELETWLRGVLDAAEQTAKEAPGLLSGVVLARVQAERAILERHEPRQVYRRAPGEHVNTIGITVPNFEPVPNRFHCDLCSDADEGGEPWRCPTLRWIAYGHRFDAPGYRAEWAPEGVRAR